MYSHSVQTRATVHLFSDDCQGICSPGYILLPACCHTINSFSSDKEMLKTLQGNTSGKWWNDVRPFCGGPQDPGKIHSFPFSIMLPDVHDQAALSPCPASRSGSWFKRGHGVSLFMDRALTGNILFKQNIFLASFDPPKKNDLPGISWIFFTFDFFYFGCWEKSAKVWAQTSVFP